MRPKTPAMFIGRMIEAKHPVFKQSANRTACDQDSVFAHKRYVDKFMWKPSEMVMNEVQRKFVKRSGLNIPWHKWPGVEDLKIKR